MVSSPASKQLASHQAEGPQKQQQPPILICIDDDGDNDDNQPKSERVPTDESAQTTTPARPANRLQRRVAPRETPISNNANEHDGEPHERVEDGIIGMKVRTPNRTSTS